MVNGLLIVRFRLNGFIVTLGMLIVLRGLLTGISGGQTFFNLPDSMIYLGTAVWVGVPASIWICLVLFAAAIAVLGYTRFGRSLYAIGGNVDAASAAGIRTDRVLWIALVIASVLAALGGLLLSGRLASVAASQGNGAIFTVFAAAVIGGVCLNGGQGHDVRRLHRHPAALHDPERAHPRRRTRPVDRRAQRRDHPRRTDHQQGHVGTGPGLGMRLTRLGRSPIEVSALAFGGAAIGGLYAPVTDADATAAVRRAHERGVRYFDTAPHYGVGRGERRLGAALPDGCVLSTKVGRLLVPLGPGEQPEPLGFADPPPYRRVWDWTAEGVVRSLTESLERIGRDRVDLVYLHDPDDHEEEVYATAYPALAALRDEGVIGAIGAGMNQSAMLARFVERLDLDVVLCAGRYTLLDRSAREDLLPACERRGTSVIVGGAYNSGLLAGGGTYDYLPASPALRERAEHLARVCAGHGVPLRAAALRFPLRHPSRGERPRRLPFGRRGRRERRPVRHGHPRGAVGGPVNVVDAHHHLWDTGVRDYPWMDGPWADPLRGRFDVDRYASVSDATTSVAVQAIHSHAETAELLRTATAPIAGVVGWTDLTAPDVADRLAELRELGPLVGIRHQAQDEPDPGWLTRPSVVRGIAAVGAAGLVYDLLYARRRPRRRWRSYACCPRCRSSSTMPASRTSPMASGSPGPGGSPRSPRCRTSPSSCPAWSRRPRRTGNAPRSSRTRGTCCPRSAPGG